MHLLDALMTRRSIRKFTGEPVPEADVNTLLAAALRAPSAADARPWQFATVRARKTLDTLADRMPKCDMLREATLALLVAADPAREKIPGFWPQDCAAATQNILLAAHGLGWGAVWIGLHPVAERVAAVRGALGIPESIIPFALVAIGRAAEQPAPDDRWDPSRLHHERW